MRYQFIERHQPVWPVIRMCEVLDVSAQGSYAPGEAVRQVSGLYTMRHWMRL
ncbi:MAG: hypothetical protein HW386_2205 [Gammaproteobacteria bacterium]|nr:hypothetical protein [Gammaproteobacteria bacterium]